MSRPAISTRRPARDILRLMSDLHVTLGSTILIVTHDATVAQTCQRTITIRDGRIISDERNGAGSKAARG